MFGASALLATFTVVVNVTAVDARSGAADDSQVVGPASITVATTATPVPAAVDDAPVESSRQDDTTLADADDPPAVPAPALGRTVMLDISGQPSATRPSAVFAYTPADGDGTTTAPLALLGGARLWHQRLDGMSPVVPIGGPSLGYAFPHDGVLERPLAVSSAGTTVVSNLAAGGATWEWTDSTGTQFLNHYDLGREVQASFFVRTSDGRKLNPTEAGDRYADQRVAPSMRHSAPLVSATVDGSTQSTLCVPLEWSPPRVDPRAGSDHPVIYPDVRLGKQLDLGYAGHADVARYDTVLTLPAPTPAGDLEAPTAYLRNSFSRLFAFDARSQTLVPIAPTPFDRKGLDWVPPTGWGGLIAADSDGAHAFAIYAATTSAGGTITRFSAHDFHVRDGADGADDVGTVKLRALRIGGFPQGTTRTTSYVVTGTLASVQATMAELAAEAVM